ncbi:MAG TPA: hypothetical protein VD816_12135 [Ohtaekwangia sp.]|nr:hypothetical protein [Ohtaekwangia sp.]
MRIVLLIFSVTVITASCVSAQETMPEEDSLAYEKFLTLVNADRDQSYVTFGGGVGNLEPMILEAKFSPSYFFSRNKKRWAVMVNPQVQLRILNQKSLPIRNPSYRVYATFFKELEFWKNSFLRKIFYENAVLRASYVHHSNGQDGSFFANDTTREVNFENGDFSTDYLELGISSYRLKEIGTNYFSIRQVKASMEYHPKSWYGSKQLKDRYGSYRLFANVGIIGPQKVLKKEQVMQWLQRSSLEVRLGWIFGRMDATAPLEASDRLIVDIQYKYYPKWFDEIAFFLRFYRGQDYYNIHFAKREVTNLSFGITSNIMNFRQAVKLLQ